MNKNLFIGNGLNRTLSNSIDWSNLLDQVSKKYGVEYISDIPLPLEFERIINTYLSISKKPSPDIYREAKDFIIQKIKHTQLPANSIHEQVLDINPKSIMTTNYDFFLEYVIDKSYSYKGPNANKYLFEKTSTLNGIDFYHIHGMQTNPQSICLGYEHYAGMVENLRSRINKKENNRSDNMLIKKVLYGESPQTNTWGEKFYTEDISFVGFGLADCEIDIWWLITHRAYLYFSDYCGLKSKINNKLVYYDIINDMPKASIEENTANKTIILRQQSKHKLLSDSNVIVQPLYLSKYDGMYVEAYKDIFARIRGD